MGRDRMDVAKLLQRHNVIVKGGPQEGRKLLDALVVSTSAIEDSTCGQDRCRAAVDDMWHKVIEIFRENVEYHMHMGQSTIKLHAS